MRIPPRPNLRAQIRRYEHARSYDETGHESRVRYVERMCVAALKEVPITTSRKFCEGLLRPLYPWGKRKGYPYRAWRKGVRAVLDERAKWSDWAAATPERHTELPMFQTGC